MAVSLSAPQVRSFVKSVPSNQMSFRGNYLQIKAASLNKNASKNCSGCRLDKKA